MGKKSAKAPPPAPDPTVLAKEQQRLNMINTSGPGGSVTYGGDPNAPGGYTQTTVLSPEQQKIWDLQTKAEGGAMQIANDQLGRVGTALSTPLDMNGLPALTGGAGLGAGAGIRSTFDKGPALRYGYEPGQEIQGQVGGDLDAARFQAQDAAYEMATRRLDPRFAREGQQLDAKLAAQGLGTNSTATANARLQAEQAKNDAYQGAQSNAVLQGNAAADELFGRQVTQGTFANTAAAQEDARSRDQAGFWNTAAGTDFGRNQGEATFANSAQGQGFAQALAAAEMDNKARNQGMQERAYIQDQPLNQFSGLMSLGQVAMPAGINYTPSDLIGATALKVNADQAAYQTAQASKSAALGGLMGLGGAAMQAFMPSDRRLKTDITLLRRRRDGVGVYRYRYRSGGPMRVGVMAQELQRVRPDLVTRLDGYLAVNYAGLGAL